MSGTPSQVDYINSAGAKTQVLEAFDVRDPVSCPIIYSLTCPDANGAYGDCATTHPDLLTFDPATRTIVVQFSTDNRYAPVDGENTHQLKLTGVNNMGVTYSSLFNLVITQHCNVLTEHTDNFELYYVLGQPQTHIFKGVALDFEYCQDNVRYEVKEFNDLVNSGQNQNGDIIWVEDWSVLETSLTSNHWFYKEDRALNYVQVDASQFGDNSKQATTRRMMVKNYFEPNTGTSNWQTFTIKFMPDCERETIENVDIPNIEYTFHTTLKSFTIPFFIVSAAYCPFEYELKVFDGTAWQYVDYEYEPDPVNAPGTTVKVYDGMFPSFDNTTRVLQVYYDVSNQFCPTNGATNIEFTFYGKIWGTQSTQQNFFLELTKNCAFVTYSIDNNPSSLTYHMADTAPLDVFELGSLATISDENCRDNLVIDMSYQDQTTNNFISLSSTTFAADTFFYKATRAQTMYNYNLNIITNLLVPATPYVVKAQYQIDCVPACNPSLPIYTKTIAHDITKNCEIEPLTAVTPDVVPYTFRAPQISATFPEFISERKDLCPVNYSILCQKDGAWGDCETLYPGLLVFAAQTRVITVHYDVDNRYSPLNTDNLIPIKYIGVVTEGGPTRESFTDLVITKDCQYATFSENNISPASLEYIVTDAPYERVKYTKPVRSDIYCAIDYRLFVSDNITNVEQLYTVKFGLDDATSTLHSDQVSRTESYLLQNQSDPEEGLHVIQVRETDVLFTDLDRFTRDANGDYFLYTLRYHTRYSPGENTGASLAEVSNTMTLKLKSWCEQLYIDYGVVDTEIEVFETKTYTMNPSTYWQWIRGYLSDSSLVTEEQVLNYCSNGNYQFTWYNKTDNTQPDENVITLTPTGFDNIITMHTNDVMQSVSPSRLTEKVTEIDVYIGLNAEYGYELEQNKRTFKMFMRYECWNTELQDLRYFPQNRTNTISSMYLEISNDEQTVGKTFNEFTYNTTCWDSIDYRFITYEHFPLVVEDYTPLVNENSIIDTTGQFTYNSTARHFSLQNIHFNRYSQLILVKIWSNFHVNRLDGSGVTRMMDDFPDFNHQFIQFYVTIDTCKIQILEIPLKENSTYPISKQTHTYPIDSPYIVRGNCEYPWIFRTYAYAWVNETRVDKQVELPDVVYFNTTIPEEIAWVVSTNNITMNGTILEVYTNLTIADEVNHRFEFNTSNADLMFFLKLFDYPVYIFNEEPFIENPDKIPWSATVFYNETWDLHMQKSDFSNDTIGVLVLFPDKAKEFTTLLYDSKSLKVDLHIAPTSVGHSGKYEFKLIVQDRKQPHETGDAFMSKEYKFYITVSRDPSIPLPGGPKSLFGSGAGGDLKGQIEDPTMKFDPISDLGELNILFNQEMFMPQQIKQRMYNSVFSVSVTSSLDGSVVRGTFSETNPFKKVVQTNGDEDGIDDEERRLRGVAEVEQASLLEFYPSVTLHNATQISIKLDFVRPAIVSSSLTRDSINLEILDMTAFQSSQTLEFLKPEGITGKDTTLSISLPTLIVDEVQAESIKSSTKNGGALLNFLSTGNFFIALILGGSMQQLFGMIRAMQMLILPGMSSVPIPSHSIIFFSACAIIAALDMLDAASYFEEWWEFKETDALTDSFDMYGMGDKNFIINSGSYFVYQSMVLFFILGNAFVNKLAVCNAKSKWWREIGIKYYVADIKQGIWDGSVKLFMETYIDLCFCALLNDYAFFESYFNKDWREFWQGYPNIMCSSITMIYTVLVFVFPLWGLYGICKNFGNLQDPVVDSKIGMFYRDNRTQYMHQALYNIVFLVRRGLSVMILIYMVDTPFFQLSLFMIFSTFNLNYIAHSKPLLQMKDNYIEVFNEICICIVAHIMVNLLNFSIPFDLKDNFGWILIGVSLFNVCVNLCITFWASIKLGWLQHVQKRAQKKAEKFLKKMFQNREDLIEEFPGQYEQFKTHKELYETSLWVKEWFRHKKWLILNKVNFSQYPEELKFNALNKKYDLMMRAKFENLNYAIQKLALNRTEKTYQRLKVQNKLEILAERKKVLMEKWTKTKKKSQPRSKPAPKKISWNNMAVAAKKVSLSTNYLIKEKYKQDVDIEVVHEEPSWEEDEKPDHTQKKELYKKEFYGINDQQLIKNVKMTYQNVKLDLTSDVQLLKKQEKLLFFADQKKQKKFNQIFIEETTEYGIKRLSTPEQIQREILLKEAISFRCMLEEDAAEEYGEELGENIFKVTKTDIKKNLKENQGLVIMRHGGKNGAVQALMQCFLEFEEMGEFFGTKEYHSLNNGIKKPTCDMMFRLYSSAFQKFRDLDFELIDTTFVFKTLKDYHPADCHDAGKMFVSVVSALLQECGPGKNIGETWNFMEDQISLILNHEKKCLAEMHASNTFITKPFLTLSRDMTFKQNMENIFYQHERDEVCEACGEDKGKQLIIYKNRIHELPSYLVMVYDYFDEEGNKKGHVQPIPYDINLKTHLFSDLDTFAANPQTFYDLFAVISVDGKTLEKSCYSSLVKRRNPQSNESKWMTFSNSTCEEVPDDAQINPQMLFYKMRQ